MRHFHHEKAPTPLAGGNSVKPTLEMVQLPIYRVHYRKLEDYLCRIFHWDEFDFLTSAGCTPGLVPEYNITGTLPPSRDAARRATAVRNSRRTRDVALILTVLCADDFIPAGRYLIDTRPEPQPIERYKTLLRQTGTPESEECRAFRAARSHDKQFTQLATRIDAQVLETLQSMKE